MTKSECYDAIAQNNKLIDQYQSEIDDLNKEVDELETTQDKISVMVSSLSSCLTIGNERLSNTKEANKVNKKITSNYFGNMSGLFTGTDKTNVDEGLSKATSRVNEEINTKRIKIQTLKNKITNCNTTINSLRNTISQIEAAEREEAERLAEETRKRMEDNISIDTTVKATKSGKN